MADEECPKLECPPGSPLWMCTFADLMSLLLCFFVLLLSFSVMDAQKYKAVRGSMVNAFGVQKKLKIMENPSSDNIISQQMPSVPLAIKVLKKIEDEVAEEIASGMIELESEEGEGEVLVRMKDSLAFDFGKATIRKQFKPVLDKIGKILEKIDASITVSGHTDNVPLSKGALYSSNWALSSARSGAVVEYWIGKFDIPTHKLVASGHADGLPLAGNDTPQGRAKNRRVEFKIDLNQVAATFQGLSDLLNE